MRLLEARNDNRNLDRRDDIAHRAGYTGRKAAKPLALFYKRRVRAMSATGSRAGALATMAVIALTMSIPARARAADPDPWFGRDKALHFSATFVIASGGYGATALLSDNVPMRLGVGGGLGIAVGAAKELYDLSGRGDPSWRDFAWDVVGTATGVGVCWMLDRFVFHRRTRSANHATALGGAISF